MKLRWRKNPDGSTEWIPIDQWIREQYHDPIAPSMRIRAMDYELDKMDGKTMRRTVETVKRYRHLGCPDQFARGERG